MRKSVKVGAEIRIYDFSMASVDQLMEVEELSDDGLLQVASDRQSLTDEAKSALDAEMRSRDLTSASLRAHHVA
jgi:hypothetical protein